MLVRDSGKLASSVKLTRTLMVLPSSASTRHIGGVRRSVDVAVVGAVVGNPLVAVTDVVQAVGVRNAGCARGQQLPNLGGADDDGSAGGLVVRHDYLEQARQAVDSSVGASVSSLAGKRTVVG